MADYALMAVTALLAVIYAGPLLIGGECWLHGWKSGSDRLSRAGDVMVLIGLLADAVLLTANWLFNWVAWVGASVA
ncbi:MAG: hypothetical protein ACYS9X_18015 [Planctomycetota bacterium]|jgi:hypothetical protein